MSDFAELRKYIAIVRRWWWLMILSTVAAAAIGFEVSRAQPPVYRASTTLIVGRSIQTTRVDSRELETSQLLAQTYADIARRQPVLQAAVESLNLNVTWQALKKQVGLTLVEGTQLLEIAVEASSLDEAQAIADEIARQLILQSPTAALNRGNDEKQLFVRQRLEALQASIEAGQVRLKDLETTMAAISSTEQKQQLQDELNKLELLIVDWQSNYVQLLVYSEAQESPNYLTVIEPAQGNPDPVRPRILLNTLLASGVGLVLGLGVIFLRAYLDNTLKSAADLGYLLGLTYLGAIGRMKGRRYQHKLISSQEPFSPESESYRFIRSNIQFRSADRPAKSIMVTSPTPGDGKSITVANLGMVMAQAGFKTILVDADLREPVLHQIFEMPNQEGLTDLLRSPELQSNGLLRNTSVENLRVITSGVLPHNPSELLNSQRMGQLLASLNEMADVIIFDSPPVLVVADAVVLSNQVDGVVLVIDAGHTPRDAAKQAMLNLQQVGANLLGGVLNRVSETRGSYYYGSKAITRQSVLLNRVKRFAAQVRVPSPRSE